MTNYQFILKVFRKLYTGYISKPKLPLLQRETDTNKISEIIYNLLQDDKPCMIARFGAFELATIINYLGIQQGPQSAIKYIKGDSLDWWWNEKLLGYMNTNAGFFPPTHEKLTQFCELMLHDAQQVDVLGSWQNNEYYLADKLKEAKKIQLMYLDPFWSEVPWSKVLKGKRVLVVHPFAETIQSQYTKRELLFNNPDILPEFKSLQIIQAVQSLGGESNGFKDWFEALEYMKNEIEKCDFEICLIGCGAYGFPLAAHVKRMGKKAVHIGGSLQLLFGIMGSRWDHDKPHYEKGTYIYYAGLENKYWVRPSNKEKPSKHHKVEDSCYW